MHSAKLYVGISSFCWLYAIPIKTNHQLIKFNCHYNYKSFQLAMILLSNISKSRSLFNQLATINFSVRYSPQAPQLTPSIWKSKTWKQFYLLFTNNKNNFTQDTFQLASKHINNLLSKEREQVNCQEFEQIILVIQRFDLLALSEVNIVSILACLRSFCIKGLSMRSIYGLKNRLCKRYTKLLIAKPKGSQNFSELIYAFYELCYFGWQPGSRFISQMIMRRINNQPQNTSILTLNQATFLLNALAVKENLDLYERRLRFYILKTLVDKIDLLQMPDLIHCLVSLNEMDFYDARISQYSNVKILGTKMIQKITQLDENMIFRFLNADHNNQHAIFYKIYEEIIKKIYREIDQNGNTKFDRKIILKQISLISSHYKFYNHSQIDKKKFYKFLRSSGKLFKTENDAEGIDLLLSSIEEAIKHRYFDQSKNSQLIEIINSNLPIRRSFIEVLYDSQMDVSQILTNCLSSPLPETMGLVMTVKVSNLFKKIYTNPNYETFNSKIQNYLQPVAKKLQEIFKSSQKFSQIFLFLFKTHSSKINFKTFHQTHEQYFLRLVNPFQEDQSSTTFQYRLAYLQYVVQCFKTKEFYKFIDTYNQKIEKILLQKVIYANINQDARKIEPSKYVLNLVLKNLGSAFERKQTQFLNATLQLIGKYNRFICFFYRYIQVATNTIKIVDFLLSRLQILKQVGLDKNFIAQFNKYIIKSKGNYKNEDIFRGILSHGLRKTQQLPLYITVQLLRQGLRLNMVVKKDIENLQIEKINSLTSAQKQSLYYILNNTYIPDVKEIKTGNLQAILLNHNLNTLIEQRQNEINSVIQKARIYELFSYLAVINQPKSKVTYRIITKIIKLINASQFSIERCDFQGAMENLIEKEWSYFNGCKELAQKIVNLLTNTMYKNSIWTHTQAIKFIIAIPSYNPTGYYQKLLQHTERYYLDKEVRQVIFKLAFTNYEFLSKDLRHVKSVLKKSIYKGTYLFLATQKLHSQAERKQIVANITQRLIGIKKDQNSINNIQYAYLKKAYPQQTSDLNLPPQLLLRNNYLIKPRQKILEILKQIAKVHKTTVQTLSDFYESCLINNVCIAFFNQRRTGSYHEHEFLKRALSLLYKQQNYKFVFVFTQVKRITELIEQQVPQFITDEVKQTVSQYLTKNMPERDQEQHDAAQQKEKHQNQQTHWLKPKKTQNEPQSQQ